MARAGELEWLTAQADSGDDVAAETLACTLAEQGSEEILLARARAGDEHAASQLASLWRASGRVPEALELLSSFFGTGAMNVLLGLASILVEKGRSAEAIEATTPRTTAGRPARSGPG